MLFRVLVASLCLTAPVARAQVSDAEQSWRCSASSGWVAGEPPTTLYFQSVELDGTPGEGLYRHRLGGPASVEWRLVGPIGKSSRQLDHLSVDAPALRDASGVYAYLYGDGRLLTKLSLLEPRAAREGFVSPVIVNFRGEALGKQLDAHDRWTVVLRNGKGEERMRRDLPVPDRRSWANDFAQRRAAIAGAWEARDPKLLETVDYTLLPPAPAHCLLSTPDTQAEMQERATIVDDLPVGPRRSAPSAPVLTRP